MSPEEYRRKYVEELRTRLKHTDEQSNPLQPILETGGRYRFRERTNLQFRAEMFNIFIFNQVNFGNPNTRLTGGGFGTITNTQSYAGDLRIIQFELKLAL